MYLMLLTNHVLEFMIKFQTSNLQQMKGLSLQKYKVPRIMLLILTIVLIKMNSIWSTIILIDLSLEIYRSYILCCLK